MNVETIVTLLNAGYTKDEISKMENSRPETASEQKATEQKASTPETSEQTSKAAEQTTGTTSKMEETTKSLVMTPEDLEKLAQMIRAGSAEIDLPAKVSIDEKLGEHLKDILLGDNRQKGE